MYESALLSEAAYANFSIAINLDGTYKEDDVRTALQRIGTKDGEPDDPNEGFSLSQATEFAENWEVVTHQADTDSGFSATLFRRKTADPSSGYEVGDYVYAIRGTAGTVDLAEDFGNIVADDLALEQIVDLYNDWIRINTLTNQSYLVARLVDTVGNGDPSQVILDSPFGYKTIEWVESTTLFSSDDSRYYGAGETLSAEQLVSVTGHSLGGHLAAAFTRLFPGLAEAVTINGAGFGSEGDTNGVDTNVPNLFAMLNGANSFNEADIQNIYGDKNPEIVTQDGPGLFQPGSHDALFIEQDSLFDNTAGMAVLK
ncbi:MAG: hypothetical protein COB23_10160 [Methylophaga sp.]|nr:MAG: hypothetical protein COB23_10160 [Methylophaga sp.]